MPSTAQVKKGSAETTTRVGSCNALSIAFRMQPAGLQVWPQNLCHVCRLDQRVQHCLAHKTPANHVRPGLPTGCNPGYTDTFGRIQLNQAAGLTTAPARVGRGTIQGDTLSPLLFLIYL